MRVFRRLLSWTMPLGLICAVGAVTFVFVRHEPRCVISGPLSIAHLTKDGSRLVTYRWTAKEGGPGSYTYGPVEVWDTQTGRVVRQIPWIGTSPQFKASVDDQHIATILDDQNLRLADWRAGTEWRFDDLGRMSHVGFSKKGHWLMASATSDTPKRFRMIDMVHRQAIPLESGWLGYSENERRGFTFDRDAEAFSVWDLKTSKKLATLPAVLPRSKAHAKDGDHTYIDSFADGRFAAIYRYDLAEPPKDNSEFNGVDVWDLATFKQRFRRVFPRAGSLHILWSPDGRTLALYLVEDDEKSLVEAVDLESGKSLFAFPMIGGLYGEFSRDGSLFYFVRRPGKLTMFDTVRGIVLWEKPTDGLTRFFGNDVVWHQKSGDDESGYTVELLEARTGEAKATFSNAQIPYTYEHWQTADGRAFLLHGMQTDEPQSFLQQLLLKLRPHSVGDEGPVMVIESATGRELFRVLNGGHGPPRLSDDGTTLLTGGRGEQTDILIWDVHPQRAWMWAVGASAAAALGLWTLRRGVRWVSKNRP